MAGKSSANIQYPKIGVCGLSCVLCPWHKTDAKSKCMGCKSETRMAVGCPFITCAVKRKGIEFCWECEENKKEPCKKWAAHREFGKEHDTFKCYQELEDNISFIKQNGIREFEKRQGRKEKLLDDMLAEFNDGRSKSYYCIVSSVFDPAELEDALKRARKEMRGVELKEKAKVLHSILDQIAAKKQYCLKLRKK